MAYSSFDPFGNERGDLQAAIISSTVSNSTRAVAASFAGQRDFKPASPIDFMPKFGVDDHKSKPMTKAQQRAEWKRFKSYASSVMGAKSKRKHKHEQVYKAN